MSRSGVRFPASAYRDRLQNRLSKKPPRTAVVLYPTSNPGAEEARIVVREPLAGVNNATVILRPLHMPTVAELVSERPTSVVERRRREYARGLVFGVGMRRAALRPYHS